MQAAVRQDDFLTMPEPLIDPNWREQSMRPWDDVYEELCKDLGHHYGLSDIREA